MKRLFTLHLILLALVVGAACLSGRPASAAQSEKADTTLAADWGTRSLKDSIFVVETDEESAAESLNRISGTIDRGFSTPEQSYDASEKNSAGPLGRAMEAERARNQGREAGY